MEKSNKSKQHHLSTETLTDQSVEKYTIKNGKTKAFLMVKFFKTLDFAKRV